MGRSERLSTCKLCRGAAIIVKRHEIFWVCGCTICNNQGIASPTKESAIELWNDMNKLVEKGEECIEDQADSQLCQNDSLVNDS